MEKTKKIYFPVYDYTVLIVVCKDICVARNKRRVDIGSELENGDYVHALHSCNEKESGGYLFFYLDVNVGLIAHECHHCITRMFQWIEADPCHEIFAYHLEYLTQQVYDFITSLNKKK